MTATLAGWVSYASERGDTIASDTDSAAALVRAQDYIQHHYISRFADGYDADSDYVAEATYEAAKLELGTPGFFTKTFTPSEQKVLTQVQGIQWTHIGGDHGPLGAAPVSTKIEAMLRPYLRVCIGLFTV